MSQFRFLCCVLITFSGLALLAPKSAQGQSEDVEYQRIEVTGSRIKKAEVEGLVPVQVIDREAIERSGLTSIGDLLQRLTASGSALNTKFNSSGNFGFPPDGGGVGAGSTSVDLRHLGPKRVLVLVDGIRWVNESSGSGVGGVVDLNTIPVSIIERIEVLEDGASSIYGSDAIGGVVNIITRRSIDGGSVDVYYGQFGEGDGDTTRADISFGNTGARHGFFFSASVADQKQVNSNTREQSSFPVPGTGVALGSSAIPAGRFIIRDPVSGVVFDVVPNTGVADPTFDRAQTTCTRTDDFHCFTGADRFNYAQFNLLVTPNRRTNLFSQFNYQVTPEINWRTKFLYNNRQSANQAAPEPFFLGQLVPTNFWADNLTIAADNPFNPFGFDITGGDNLLLVGRRPIEGGPRVFEQDVDTFYFSTGLEGSFAFGSRVMFWDVNMARSTNRANQTNFGSYNARHLATALGPLADCQADPQCVPLDIFGAGTITPAMLAYVQPVVRDYSENKLRLLSANLSGDLFSLPAGSLAFATGFEHREYSGEYRPDGLVVAGEYNGVPSLPTQGEYDVSEYYLELNAPLVADTALARRLDLSVAARFSDYSTFGSVTTLKTGVRWQVNDEFLLRGTFAEGFRAPNIGELFGAASGFDAVLNDPCSAPIAAGLVANCAALGVPVGYVQPNPQISVVTGGNANLNPETADSISFGSVWSPTFLTGTGYSDRIDFGLTWYQHELEGAIQALDAQTQLDLCVATREAIYCDGISRNATGAISNFNNFLTNLGRIETSGFDFDVAWRLPAMSFGQVGINWRSTWVSDYEAVGADGARQPQGVGVEVNDSGIPEFSSNLIVDWRNGDWYGSWGMRHLSDMEESCGSAATFPVCRDQANETNRLGSTTYHDLQLGWTGRWGNGLDISFGVNNLFGKEPPICLSCTLNGYDASNYDPPGSRFWYLRAVARF